MSQMSNIFEVQKAWGEHAYIFEKYEIEIPLLKTWIFGTAYFRAPPSS